jgi:hypothetical protein
MPRRHRSSTKCLGSEPIVCDTSPVSWKIVSSREPVMTDDGDRRHVLRIGQAQVDPHGTSPVFARVQASPIRHAAARGAEVKHDPPSSCVGLGRTRDIDAAALEFVGPQRAVATTCGAIARRGRLGRPFEAPLNCAAVARASDHFSGLTVWASAAPAKRQRSTPDATTARSKHAVARQLQRLVRRQ